MGDGEFWIDPDASGTAFKVYCDMTTDKGKKNKSCKKEKKMKTTGHFDEIDINMPSPPPALGHTPGIWLVGVTKGAGIREQG